MWVLRVLGIYWSSPGALWAAQMPQGDLSALWGDVSALWGSPSPETNFPGCCFPFLCRRVLVWFLLILSLVFATDVPSPAAIAAAVDAAAARSAVPATNPPLLSVVAVASPQPPVLLGQVSLVCLALRAFAWLKAQLPALLPVSPTKQNMF